MDDEEFEILDLNKASVDELEKLPGIGRVKATSIIEYRDSLGGVSSIDGLSCIPGITKKLLNTLKSRLTCEESIILRSGSVPAASQPSNGRTLRKSVEGGKITVPNSTSRLKMTKRKITPSDEPCADASADPSSEKKSKLAEWVPEELGSSSSSSDQPISGSSLSSDERFKKSSLPRLSCATPGDVVRRRLHSSLSSPPSELSSWLGTFGAWTSDERLSALDSLVELCDMSLIRHLMARIEPQFQRDFISLLPKELALYVLSFLEPKDLCRAAQTCRYWRILAEDNLLWREKCQEYDIAEESDEEPQLRTVKKRLSPTSATKVEVVNNGCPFKKLFIRRHQIELNWRSKEVRPPKLLKGHDDHVITCLQFDGVRIVSGSDDNTLKVWSAVTGKIIRTLQGHTGGVWSSQLKGNIVVSGSTDRTLRVWNADTGECVYVLYGHTSTVRCLAMHESTVVSGSRDGTLRVWDITNGVCLHVLVGHAAAVRCVQYDGRRVVSGAYDYLVKVWDPETESCLHTLSGHSNRVYSLQFDGTHIVSGSLDTSIRVWNTENGQLMHTLLGHQSLTSGMVLKNNILVSGNADSTVKVWDIITGQCLYTLAGPSKHQSAVTSLQFNCKFVVTSSDDGSVKLWDLRTGEFIRDLVKLDSGGSGGVVWRVKCNDKKLVCAVGSRNGTEETKLLVLDFDADN